MEEFKSEKEKMIAGALYFASDPELVADRKKAREQMALINQQPRHLYSSSINRRNVWKSGCRDVHRTDDSI